MSKTVVRVSSNETAGERGGAVISECSDKNICNLFKVIAKQF